MANIHRLNPALTFDTLVGGRANPINLPWAVDEAEVRRAIGSERGHLLNDLLANAWGIGELDEEILSIILSNIRLADQRSGDELVAYPEKFRSSWLYDELYRARNFKPLMNHGLRLGSLLFGIDQNLLLVGLELHVLFDAGMQKADGWGITSRQNGRFGNAVKTGGRRREALIGDVRGVPLLWIVAPPLPFQTILFGQYLVGLAHSGALDAAKLFDAAP